MFTVVSTFWKIPFTQLTMSERVLQMTRLITCVLAVGLCAVALLAPVFTSATYISRINCSHLDVSAGLYNSLQSAVSTNAGGGYAGNGPKEAGSSIPSDSTLTSSEVIILTSYAEEQVASAPQFTLSSLWTWCYGNYDTINTYTDGVLTTKEVNKKVVCNTVSNDYITDYRRELVAIGLTSMLAYAFETDSYMDASYEAAVARRKKRYKGVPVALLVGIVSQFVVLILTFIVYVKRGPKENLSRIAPAFMNFIALVTILSCAAMIFAASTVTVLISEISDEIQAHLGPFGVHSEFGSIWFSLVWVSVAFSIFSMFSWIIPLWCAIKVEEEDHDEGEHIDSSFSDTPAPYRDDETAVPSSRPLSTQRFKDMFHSKNEIELRKLGEHLSKKTSVRRTKSEKRERPMELMNAEDTKELLYDKNFPSSRARRDLSHYRETTYDGYQESTKRQSQQSFLNDDEANYLDTGNLLNKLV